MKIVLIITTSLVVVAQLGFVLFVLFRRGRFPPQPIQPSGLPDDPWG